jgi:hypothetical protein
MSKKPKIEIVEDNVDSEEDKEFFEGVDRWFAHYEELSSKVNQEPAETKQFEDAMVTDIAKNKRVAEEDANWKSIPDVDYTDLDHFIGNCRRKKDLDSFNTAIRILEGIKKQVSGK